MHPVCPIGDLLCNNRHATPHAGARMQRIVEVHPHDTQAALHDRIKTVERQLIVEVVDRYLGVILIEEMTVEEALAAAAQEVYDILVEGGYDVAPLP